MYGPTVGVRLDEAQAEYVTDLALELNTTVPTILRGLIDAAILEAQQCAMEE